MLSVPYDWGEAFLRLLIEIRMQLLYNYILCCTHKALAIRNLYWLADVYSGGCGHLPYPCNARLSMLINWNTMGIHS
jgi:hypothetical protein